MHVADLPVDDLHEILADMRATAFEKDRPPAGHDPTILPSAKPTAMDARKILSSVKLNEFVVFTCYYNAPKRQRHSRHGAKPNDVSRRRHRLNIWRSNEQRASHLARVKPTCPVRDEKAAKTVRNKDHLIFRGRYNAL